MDLEHNYGSFDYKVIADPVKNVLNARSRLDNTVQVSMPFIKATTTLQLPNILGNGNIGFTLGLHGIDESVDWFSMFSEQSNEMPLIGYTYDPAGSPSKVYAKEFKYGQGPANSNTLYTSPTAVNRLPPPGITQATIGRNKNGLLVSAQLTISVPSLLQLETLQKTFFVPGLGMIIEWGQQFPPLSDQERVPINSGEFGLDGTTINDYLFPWDNREKLTKLLTEIARNEVGLPRILNNYVYPSQGQYMWMFGRVANFSMINNADGSFECTVKIVGPSEDSWAYSTKNTVVPPKDKSTEFYCSTKTNSIYKYFTDTVPGENFKTKLDYVLNPDNKDPWKNHVIRFEQKTSGKDTADTDNAITSQKTFANLKDSYFISWRFFVNEVLNGNKLSVRSSVFKNALTDDEMRKVGMLISYASGPERSTTDVAQIPYINDPYESFVGYNDALRSIDVDTMIIVNEKAVELAKNSQQYEYIKTAKENIIIGSPQGPQQRIKQISLFDSTADDRKFIQGVDNAPMGRFDRSVPEVIPEREQKNDSGFLSAGVWINHKAIVECMMGADTLMRGISNLLDRMNAATANYWQLTLDNLEPQMTGNAGHTYMVVDANYRDSSERAVAKFIDKVYTFNKLVRKNDELVGSELINCTIDLSLPKKLFSQIATLGLVQPEDLAKAGIPPENRDTEKSDTAPKISDPNDSIREIFSQLTTELFVADENEQGPDLTILPATQRKQLRESHKTCGVAESGTTAQTSGDGYRPNKVEITSDIADASLKELEAQRKEAASLLESDDCKLCENCEDKKEPPAQVPVAIAPSEPQVLPSTNKTLSQLTIGEILSVIKPAGDVFAMGKYQLVPNTFRLWVNADKVDKSLIFNAETQEKALMYLLSKKKPNVMKYINGDPSVTLTQAHVSLTQEFASIALPVDTPRTINGKRVIVPRGSSYYSPDTQNKIGGVSAESNIKLVNDALLESKRLKSIAPISDVIASYESSYKSDEGTTSSAYDVINTGDGQRGFVKLKSDKYFKLLNPDRLTLSNIIRGAGAGGIGGAIAAALPNVNSIGAGGVAGAIPDILYENGKPLTKVSYIGKFSGKTKTAYINYNYCEGKYKALCDAGLRNGRIPSNRLVTLADNAKIYTNNQPVLMLPEAADKWNKLIEAAKLAGFTNIQYTDSYRSLEEQVRLIRTVGIYKDEPPRGSALSEGLAAKVPGTSTHGWGLTVDLQIIPGQTSIRNRPTAYNSPLYKWLKENASKYGFDDTVKTTKNPDGSTKWGEPWHWEYVESLAPQPSSPVNTPMPTPTLTPTPTATATTSVPVGSTCDATYEQLGRKESVAPLRTGVAPLRTSVSPLTSTVTPLRTGVTPLRTGVSPVSDYISLGKQVCDRCLRAKNLISQLDTAITQKNAIEEVKRKFPEMQRTFRYHEIFPDYMVATIASKADGNFANAFGASPGTLSISADIELPGINGIRVGELFWIDRIPTFYKLFGAFQVLSIEETINTSGWITKIHARFNYLGKLWKEAMAKKLNSGELIL